MLARAAPAIALGTIVMGRVDGAEFVPGGESVLFPHPPMTARSRPALQGDANDECRAKHHELPVIADSAAKQE